MTEPTTATRLLDLLREPLGIDIHVVSLPRRATTLAQPALFIHATTASSPSPTARPPRPPGAAPAACGSVAWATTASCRTPR